MALKWKGIFPALTTPFTQDERLDLNMFSKNLLAQLDAGVHGVVLGGTLGESSVLTIDEKKQLVSKARELVGTRIPVVLNIAEGSLREALNQVSLARDWGVDGLMLLPPMRYKTDERETVNWFRKIAKAAELPIMIYNNPVDYKTEITLDMFAALIDVENIQAVKESTRDVTNVVRMRNRFGNRFAILCGVDTIALEELALGADGWVAGLVCAFPGETVELYNLVSSGKMKEARNLYQWFMPLLELDIHSKLVQYIKLATQMTGIGSEWVREPRLVLEGDERKRISAIIENAIQNKR